MSIHDDAETKPTIETILNRINKLDDNLQAQLNSLHVDVGRVKTDISSVKTDLASVKSDLGSVKSEMTALRNEFQLFRGEMEIRIDRVEGMTNQTRAEMLNLRADFREWKDLLNASEA